MNVTDLKPGTIYRPTRSAVGMPNTYAYVLAPKAVQRLARRLAKRTRLTTSDERAKLAALDATAGNGVVLEIFSRYLSRKPDGRTHRIELRRYLGMRFETHDGKPVTAALRAVKSKPGYATGTKPAVATSNKQEEPDATVQP